MKRRTFIANGSVLAAAPMVLSGPLRKLFLNELLHPDSDTSLYTLFNAPPSIYHPFVRWWWNGDRVEKEELARELRLLKTKGIGGVEINPIRFPAKTDPVSKPAVQWLSKEWIDLFDFATRDARSLDMTTDLIVGSGWPFGAEWLEGEERSQIMVIGTKKLEGPVDYEISIFELFREADPPISSPFAGRRMELVSLLLAPAALNDMSDIKDCLPLVKGDHFRYKIPEGRFVLYALVKINGFMEVIQGAPGATGPVLNHYNEAAVKKYLHRMSDNIQAQIGALSSRIRALFTDSLELEGANWCDDMREEFQRRRGYDILPFLPFVLFKIAAMGNTWVYDHGATFSETFKDKIQRMRYDFELTKAELINERFVNVFVSWCSENKVKSRMQAYGRGYFPIEGSLASSLPECETWIRPGLGQEMSQTDYRVGRAYTVVNKFVSSAAHLKGERHVSCEELTNIHEVFNESLELMKIAGDQSILSGATHPIFHGFNYSPADAPFPGWVIYGTFINERNPWWPWFQQFTLYKARLSALLQQADMFADIAVLTPTADLWSQFSAQNDPFPAVTLPAWQSLVWESIHQNGNGCDYISEKIIGDGQIVNGHLQYGQRKYHSLFFAKVESMDPSTAKKLFDFALAGGKLYFIDCFPSKTPGWRDHQSRDDELFSWIEKLKKLDDRCFTIDEPAADHTGWFKNIQRQYGIKPYVHIDAPNPFVSQVRYSTKDADMLVLINSNINAAYNMHLEPSMEIVSGRQPWLWDPETGNRHKLSLIAGSLNIELEPADLKLIVFDKERKGPVYLGYTTLNEASGSITSQWSVVGTHVDGTTVKSEMNELRDLKDVEGWANFCGVIRYNTTLVITGDKRIKWVDIGKVHGVCELLINGVSAGSKWYGRRIFAVDQLIHIGKNVMEIYVTTTMGNYLKTLKNNPVAQYWTNEGRTVQPVQSMGMMGPVTLYS